MAGYQHVPTIVGTVSIDVPLAPFVQSVKPLLTFSGVMNRTNARSLPKR